MARYLKTAAEPAGRRTPNVAAMTLTVAFALSSAGTTVSAAQRSLPPYAIDGGASNPCRGPVYRRPYATRQRGGLPVVNGSEVQYVPTDYGVVSGDQGRSSGAGGVPVLAGGSLDCGYARPLGVGTLVILQRPPMYINVRFLIHDDEWDHDSAPTYDEDE